MQHKTISFKNKTIHYAIHGEGKPVILLHGFGEDSSVWKSQINFLQPHFRLIVPDIPGSGQSELIPGATLETYAEALKEICNRELSEVSPMARNVEGIAPEGVMKEKVALIGHSMGGYITLAFAEKYPEYLNSFGLFHSSALADTEEKKQVRKKAIVFMQEKGAATFLKTGIPDLFTKEFNQAHPEKINELIEKGNNFSKEALIQYYEAMIERPERTSVLKNFERPVLFIMGEQDKAIPLQISLRQCHFPIQSHVHVLTHSAHMGMWEEQERSNTILLDFLLWSTVQPV